MIPSELVRAIKARNVIPLVGAGFSIEAGLPTTETITATLCKDIGIRLQKTDSLEVIAEIYENLKGRVELCKMLRELLNEDKAILSKGHRKFAELVRNGYFHTVITTNYDNILEKAIESIPRKPRVRRIMTDSPIPYIEHDEVKILKYHGSIERETTIIISEKDYFIAMEDRKRLHEHIANLFKTHELLLVGFSMRDFDFKLLFHNLRYIENRFCRRAFMVGPKNKSKKWEIEKKYYWEAKNVCIIEMTAEDFFSKISHIIE